MDNNKNVPGDSLEALMMSFPEEWNVGVFECCREPRKDGTLGPRRWVAAATPAQRLGPPQAPLGSTGAAACHETPTEAVAELLKTLVPPPD